MLSSVELGNHFSLRHEHATFLGASVKYTNYKGAYASFMRSRADSPWDELLTLHTDVILAVMGLSVKPRDSGLGTGVSDYVEAYTKQHELVTVLHRWLMNSTTNNGWCLHLLYTVCTDLKRLAEQADSQLKASTDPIKQKQGHQRHKLEEASRLLQKCFAACLNDRTTDVNTNRKMGVYFMASLLFKTYFRLSSTALCANIIRGIKNAALPEFGTYPQSHRVAYSYYLGVLSFLKEQYAEAEGHFSYALEKCHKSRPKNLKLILDYLVPLQLQRGVLPSKKLYKAFPELKSTYQSFAASIRSGNVERFDKHLMKQEQVLMRRNTYLLVEKAREGALRALMKKAWILEGKPGRMPIETFRQHYVAGSREVIDADEMECMLANLIFKNLIKGYISHQHQIVVLSKEKPFPWYAPYVAPTPAQKEERNTKEMAERKRVITIPPLRPPVPATAAKPGDAMDTS